MRLGISTKVVTRPEQRKNDGTNVIYLRVTKNRKSRYLSTGLTATAADLSRDRKKIKNYQLLDQAEAIHRRARQILVDHATEFNLLEAGEVVERLATLLSGGDRFFLDFADYAKRLADGCAFSMRRNFNVAVKSFFRFLNAEKLNTADITNKMLSDFADELTRQGLHQNTVANYTLRIASIYRAAQREYNDDYVTNLPRLITFKVPTIPRESVRAVTIEDINKLIAFNPPTYRAQMARDMFLISFFLCGMNFIDICTADAPCEGVLRFRRSKIKKIGAAADMELIIPRKLWPILRKYSDRSGRYFTNIGKLKGAPDRKKIDREMCCVGTCFEKIRRKLHIENLTFYSARHSFATIARNVLKIEKATIDECLTHVGEHRMTDVYIKRDYSAVNAVCAAVADLFDLSKYNGGLDVS